MPYETLVGASARCFPDRIQTSRRSSSCRRLCTSRLWHLLPELPEDLRSPARLPRASTPVVPRRQPAWLRHDTPVGADSVPPRSHPKLPGELPLQAALHLAALAPAPGAPGGSPLADTSTARHDPVATRLGASQTASEAPEGAPSQTVQHPTASAPAPGAPKGPPFAGTSTARLVTVVPRSATPAGTRPYTVGTGSVRPRAQLGDPEEPRLRSALHVAAIRFRPVLPREPRSSAACHTPRSVSDSEWCFPSRMQRPRRSSICGRLCASQLPHPRTGFPRAPRMQTPQLRTSTPVVYESTTWAGTSPHTDECRGSVHHRPHREIPEDLLLWTAVRPVGSAPAPRDPWRSPFAGALATPRLPGASRHGAFRARPETPEDLHLRPVPRLATRHLLAKFPEEPRLPASVSRASTPVVPGSATRLDSTFPERSQPRWLPCTAEEWWMCDRPSADSGSRRLPGRARGTPRTRSPARPVAGGTARSRMQC